MNDETKVLLIMTLFILGALLALPWFVRVYVAYITWIIQ
jgi:hypothetical protein